MKRRCLQILLFSYYLRKEHKLGNRLIMMCYLSSLARAVFWHSSAHILGEAMERHYGGHLCYGPPIEEGYYYDMFCDGRLVREPFPFHSQEFLKSKFKTNTKFHFVKYLNINEGPGGKRA